MQPWPCLLIWQFQSSNLHPGGNLQFSRKILIPEELHTYRKQWLTVFNIKGLTSCQFDARVSETQAEEYRTHTETHSSNWFQLSFYILHETLKSLHNRRLKGNYNIMKDMWAVPSTKYVSDVFLTLTHNSEKFCLKVGRNIVLSPCSRVIPWICLWPGIKW